MEERANYLFDPTGERVDTYLLHKAFAQGKGQTRQAMRIKESSSCYASSVLKVQQLAALQHEARSGLPLHCLQAKFAKLFC